MTKLISILIVLVVVFVGFRLYHYWEKVESEKYEEAQAAKRVITEESLSGMPYELESSLRTARDNGSTTFGKWLDYYGSQIQDPRLAWIQLDYARMLLMNNPSEAKRIYESVRQRTGTNSPVYHRMKEYEKTFEEK
jgi:hypothetical protein